MVDNKKEDSILFYLKGWVGLCPVYLTGSKPEDIIDTRRGVPDWWLDFNIVIFEFLHEGFYPLEDFLIPVRVTGEMKYPILMVFED